MKLCLASVILLFLAACGQSAIPRYAGPSGEGRLVYEPGVGITRTDAATDQTEQTLFANIEQAFKERRFEQVIGGSLLLSQNYPDGSRVVEALIMRVQARLEYGRNHDREEGLPETLSMSQWMFLYLAPIRDERLQAMINRDAESRDFVNEWRSNSVGEFVAKLEPDAFALFNSGQLEEALLDCRDLLVYYLPALELREFRLKVAETTRDVAWLMYVAGAFDACIALSNDLLAMNPSPSIKADALFIQAQAQRRNGAPSVSANTFSLLFNGAGLRDTDTRWRPYALMWQINQTMESAKGPMYDLVPYERALELLGEYELYMLENPNIPGSIHEEFIKLFEDVYGVMIARDLNSADAYWRLGESEASDYYIARAGEWEKQRDRRIAELNRGP